MLAPGPKSRFCSRVFVLPLLLQTSRRGKAYTTGSRQTSGGELGMDGVVPAACSCGLHT